MAQSKCPSCDNKHFELKPATAIAGSKYDFYFIQCSDCGAVVGTHETQYLSRDLDKIKKKLGIKD